MPDFTEYIESYFQQTLNSDEKRSFENRCETDEAFASQVAVYLTSRQVLREELLQQKMNEWKDLKTEEEVPVIAMHKKTTFGKWTMYAAAACLLLAASVYLFETNSSPKSFAANYVKKNYEILGVQMDASRDSIQLGLDAYNKQNYSRALELFKGVEAKDATNSDAKQYAGITYLKQNDYDNAYKEFDALSMMKLHSNPGDFLKATTLLERNNAGDKEAAKQLLQKVSDNKEENYEIAEEWLKKF